MLKLGLATVILAAVAMSKRASPPRFEDYPAAVSTGQTLASPDVSTSAQAHRYQTLLRASGKATVDFAGHFTVVRIGCGASCALLAIVDRTSGRVFFPPELGVLSYASWVDEDYGYAYRRDSRLVRACGQPSETGPPACRYYDWTGSSARLITTIPPRSRRPPANAPDRPSAHHLGNQDVRRCEADAVEWNNRCFALDEWRPDEKNCPDGVIEIPDGEQTPRCVPCNKADRQQALNYCTARRAKATEAELGVLFGSVLTDFPSHRSEVRSSQRAWIKHRDAECAKKQKEFEGGTVAGEIVSKCRYDMAQKRMETLKAQRELWTN